MASHTSLSSPIRTSQSGKLAVILAPPIPSLPSSSSATASSALLISLAPSSGNFVLRNSTDLVWFTLNNPTGTLLPNQNFTSSKKLESRLFSFRLFISGNLTIQWNKSIVYWNSGVNLSININFTSPILRLQSIGLLSITNPSSSAHVIMAYGSDYAEGTDILRFLKLDSDGNLRIYSSPKGSGPIGNGWKLHAWIVTVVVIVTILCLVTLKGGLWWWCCRNSPKFWGLSAQYALLEYASAALVQFSYKELQEAWSWRI
ncbi:hypothetical protein CsSME_00045686 [Camellia sinensis var. sinensis]